MITREVTLYSFGEEFTVQVLFNLHPKAEVEILSVLDLEDEQYLADPEVYREAEEQVLLLLGTEDEYSEEIKASNQAEVMRK